MSKGLVALQFMRERDMFLPSCASTIEKELKALDIISEKSVQISWFTSLLKNFPNYTHDDYNFALPDNMQLMKEEYEILKEVLS